MISRLASESSPWLKRCPAGRTERKRFPKVAGERQTLPEARTGRTSHLHASGGLDMLGTGPPNDIVLPMLPTRGLLLLPQRGQVDWWVTLWLDRSRQESSSRCYGEHALSSGAYDADEPGEGARRPLRPGAKPWATAHRHRIQTVGAGSNRSLPYSRAAVVPPALATRRGRKKAQIFFLAVTLVVWAQKLTDASCSGRARACGYSARLPGNGIQRRIFIPIMCSR